MKLISFLCYLLLCYWGIHHTKNSKCSWSSSSVEISVLPRLHSPNSQVTPQSILRKKISSIFHDASFFLDWKSSWAAVHTWTQTRKRTGWMSYLHYDNKRSQVSINRVWKFRRNQNKILDVPHKILNVSLVKNAWIFYTPLYWIMNTILFTKYGKFREHAWKKL